MKLKDIGEFGFIDRIRPETLTRPENVIKGIGDDCSVCRSTHGHVTLLTTDMLVEGVHFHLASIPPHKLGRKSIAVNLSDIAAMGGTPKEALVSIAIPDTVPVETLDSLYEGMKSMAREFDVNLVGGDTTGSPLHLVINVALVGEAREEEVLYRSGAKLEDVVFLTGPVGTSAAGLDSLLSKRSFEGQDALLEAHLDPQPHVRAGRIIAGLGVAHSMIDVSDGLAGDLGHICTESSVGAIIEEGKIPTTELFRAYCERFQLDPTRLATHVGEDYVLLGTVPEKSAGKLGKALESAGCEFFRIGKIVEGPGVRLLGRDGSTQEMEPSGWNHFA
jgi:thiamine-monophosphate kinase